MTDIPWTTRMVEVKGIELPWKRVARYGPPVDPIFKGEVIEVGVVFIAESVLWEVAERTMDDYLMHNLPPSVGYHEGLALEQAGLAERETRGGLHGTQLLHTLLGE